MDDLYFSRSATWELLDGKLTVHDSFTPRAPRLITMEPWYAAVFLAAEGTLTIRAFVERLATEYESGPPPGLGETVHQVIRTLVGEGIVRAHERPIPLPYEEGRSGILASPGRHDRPGFAPPLPLCVGPPKQAANAAWRGLSGASSS